MRSIATVPRVLNRDLGTVSGWMAKCCRACKHRHKPQNKVLTTCVRRIRNNADQHSVQNTKPAPPNCRPRNPLPSFRLLPSNSGERTLTHLITGRARPLWMSLIPRPAQGVRPPLLCKPLPAGRQLSSDSPTIPSVGPAQPPAALNPEENHP